nr:glycosyltransferase [uncultured Desulfobulbus sp.]
MGGEIGIVIIGRNEGDRLKRCLQSAIQQTQAIVYVDSGSTDESVFHAESMGIDVIHLDMTEPFSAGRARNYGFHHLVQNYQVITYIQFIDGDCELVAGWLDFAQQQLEENGHWGVVAGRRRERFPERSIYNQLCDIEWNTPIGEARSCGGDFMVRVDAFLEVDGFNPKVIAGEEPELCYRLRQKGWKIWRLKHEMTIHDAAIMYFYQWWKRSVRSGHAYAQGVMLHGREQNRYCVSDSLRIWFWAFFLPIAIPFFSLKIHPSFSLFFMLYPLLFLKIMAQMKSRNTRLKFASAYSLFNIIGKIPQFAGQIVFFKRILFKKRITIIEYS